MARLLQNRFTVLTDQTYAMHWIVDWPACRPGTRMLRRPHADLRGAGAVVALAVTLLGSSLNAGPLPLDAASAVGHGTIADAPRFRPFLEPDVPANISEAVSRRLAFASVLEPGGIQRPHWLTFDDVGPDAAPAAPDAERFVVAIDPGHGGSDPGAEGPNGLLEKHLTLDIARRIRLFLSEIDGIEVVLTRERDHGLSRGARVAAVRRSEADLFVSLHFNHLPQREITLVESFYAGPDNIAESQALQRARETDAAVQRTTDASTPDLGFTRGSARFAQLVQRRVHEEVARDNADAVNAGVKRDTLFVLTRSFTSGALIELTCLSNPGEAERLTDEHYRDALAAGLADAIREYRRSLDRDPLDATDA